LSVLLNLSLIQMMPPIQFHDELSFHTTEIHDVGSDGVLPAKFHLIDLTRTQATPERAFRVGLFAT
jgi:hypothetical protein